jgi:pyrophosphatase PpaX
MSGADARHERTQGAPVPAPPVLFDLDGTLIATRRLYLEAFADALEPELGHRPDHDGMMRLRPRAEARFLREVGGAAAHGRVMARFYESYTRRHPADFEGVYPGIREMLSGLRAAGRILGIVTGKSRRAWTITRPHADLGPFTTHVFDDDVEAPKPDPSGLRLALERIARPPEGAAYAGDSATDLEAAASAGLIPVAVLWSKRDHERTGFAALARELGGYAVETPEALLERLEAAAAAPEPRRPRSADPPRWATRAGG